MIRLRFEIIALFLIPILATLLKEQSVIDLAGWTALGRDWINHASIFSSENFSILPTSNEIYPSYSLALLYGFLFPVLQMKGLILFHTVFISTIVLGLVYAPLIRDRLIPANRFNFYLIAYFWIAAGGLFAARPAFIALIPTLMAYRILTHEKLDRRAWIKLICIQIAWTNLHGSFVLLPLMLGWRIVFGLRPAAEKKHEALLFLLCFSACLLNPYGYQILPYVIQTARDSGARGVHEWMPPIPKELLSIATLYWITFLAWVSYLFNAHRLGELRQKLQNPYFIFMILGMLSIRNAALSNFFALPAAYSLRVLSPSNLSREQLTASTLLDAARAYVTPVCVAAIVIIGAVLIAPKFDDSIAPNLIKLVQARSDRCPIFNSWNLGSDLMLESSHKIFIDSRNSIYSREDYREYQTILETKGRWKDLLSEHGICFVMVKNNEGEKLIAQLKTAPEFLLRGSDQNYSLFEKVK